jgi:hypothetical protein
VGVAGAGSGTTVFGRTVMTGAPWRAWVWTVHSPENTDWVATGPSGAASTSTASVMMPAFNRTATRAATSLPSGPELTSTATGETRAARAAIATAFATGGYASVAAGAEYTVVAP